MYKLVKIKPTGIRITIADDTDDNYLIRTAKMMIVKNPSDSYGVTDNLGFFVWTEKLAQAHIKPVKYEPLVKQEYT